MTEDEAKGKACCGPPATAAATLLARKDVSATPLEGTTMGLCIASRCMAWRWRPYPRGVTGPGDGYCGLAGPSPWRP